MDNRQQEIIHSLMVRHTTSMVRLTYRRVGDGHLAEDLVQETFLTACWKADQVCSHPRPTGWLFETLNYLTLREVRRSYHTEVLLDETSDAYGELELPMHIYLPAGLSEQDKELILLRVDKGLSFDEIAEYYGITNVACRKRLSRAIQKCRTLLEKESQSGAEK